MSELGDRLIAASYLEGDFVLRSGARSKYYLDKYLFGTRPDLLRDLAAGLARLLPACEPYDVLAGPELGAVPLVTSLSLLVDKPFVIVRKTEKDYGTKRLLEGRSEPGQRAVVVEDIVTSGGAALQAVRALREAGLEVRGVLCVVDREQGGTEAFAAEGVRLDRLFTASGLGIKV